MFGYWNLIDQTWIFSFFVVPEGLIRESWQTLTVASEKPGRSDAAKAVGRPLRPKPPRHVNIERIRENDVNNEDDSEEAEGETGMVTGMESEWP